jgi:hypothetical protein
MSRPSKSRRTTSGRHRKYRQKLDTGNALVAGDPRLQHIVYCYRFPSRPDRVKIGFSTRGLARVAEQSTAFPEKPEIVFVIHDRRAKTIESAFHEALAHRQADVLGTEWFDVGLKDLFAVSPILRKAAGKNTARRFEKTGLVVILCLISFMLYIPLAATQIHLFQGGTPSQMSGIWSAWSDAVMSLDMARVWNYSKATLRQVWGSEMFWLWKVFPLIPACAPFGLLYFLRRQQAY